MYLSIDDVVVCIRRLKTAMQKRGYYPDNPIVYMSKELHERLEAPVRIYGIEIEASIFLYQNQIILTTKSRASSLAYRVYTETGGSGILD
jgi:hypothetical protein